MTFVSKRFVLAYHRRLVELFGGSHGLRDEGLLESALAQPLATFGEQYLHVDLWEMAAAYAFRLVNNHVFHEGNKRIAAVVMGVFLEVNGAALRADEAELYQVMVSLADGSLDKPQLAGWLRLRAPYVSKTE